MSAAFEVEGPNIRGRVEGADQEPERAHLVVSAPVARAPFDLETLRAALLQPLSETFGHVVHEDRVSLLRAVPTGVADATTQLLLKSPAGDPFAVVLCSSPVAPGLIARAMERARVAKGVLGAELGRHILDPLGAGEVLGVSWAALPFCRTLGGQKIVSRVMSRVLAPNVLEWLREVTRATVALPTEAELEERYQAPLATVTDLEAFPLHIRQAAWAALGRLRLGAWRPRVQLMHQDLWSGNVLIDERPEAVWRARTWASRFVVIDWPGSLLRGHPFFDLVRFADSTPVTRWELRHEIERHARLVGCEPSDARGYVLAAAGHIARLPDHFPLAALVAMTERCIELLDASGI